MVKFFFSFLLFVGLAKGSVLETVKTFVEPPTYRAKQNLIKALFSNEQKYINNITGKEDTLKIITTLKNNALLPLTFKTARNIKLTFDANAKPLLTMRLINDTLESLGYTYYLTDSIKKNAQSIIWSININTQNVVDPIFLTNKLQDQNCNVEEIRKNGAFQWIYRINTQNATIRTLDLPFGMNKLLKRPNKPYWIKVDGAQNIFVKVHPSDHWFPQVLFYDNNLEPIKELSMNKKYTKLTIKIPKNASYVKIEDKFLLDNIKRGLEVRID